VKIQSVPKLATTAPDLTPATPFGSETRKLC